MAVTLTATNVPAPVLPTVTIDISDSGDNPLTSYTFPQGMTSGFTTNLNKQGKRLDLLATYGAGGYGVVDGLAVSAGTGLLADISAGKANIGGIVELAASSVVVSASSTNWIWLKADGTTVVATTTAKPTGECCLLGAAVTDGSGVTSVETSGVVYFRSGMLWRETADTLAPGDTLNAAIRIYTKTAGGEYFWNGSQHLLLASAGSPVTKTFTVGYADLQTAGTSNTANALVMPARSMVLGAKLRVATAFAGSGITSCALDLGITGTATKYISALDGTTTGSDSDFTGYAESDSSTVQTVVQATSGGANLDQLTAGSAVVTLIYATSG